MLFSQDVTDNCTLAESADFPLFICRDHPTPPLLGSIHGVGSLGFRWPYADKFGVRARGANRANVLARLIAGGKKAGLDVHDMSLASGSADVLGFEVPPAKARIAVGRARVVGTCSASRADGLFASSH